ncbi:ribosome maturation factor RimM [soil metagenome]
MVVGFVRGLHGLRGVLRVEVLTDSPQRFEPGSVVYAEGSSQPLTVSQARPAGPGLIIHFSELRDRNAAEALRDTYLEAETAGLPEQTWYWHEIVGCQVETTTGEPLGTVDDVMRVGEAEVYVVKGGQRGELLVPAVQSIVVELAPAEGRLRVDAAALGLEEA